MFSLQSSQSLLSYDGMCCTVANSIVVVDSNIKNLTQLVKPEPNMLKSLQITPSKTSQKVYLLFLFYSHITVYYSHIILCAIFIQVLRSKETQIILTAYLYTHTLRMDNSNNLYS